MQRDHRHVSRPRGAPRPASDQDASPEDTGPERARQEDKPAAAMLPSALRALPSVDELVRLLTPQARAAGAEHPPHAALVAAARVALQAARDAIRAGGPAPDEPALVNQAAQALAQRQAPHLAPLINATGVIINTNLGRAPLSEAAIAQMVAVARGYSNLEYDLDAGERGSRQSHLRGALRSLTGAEDALAVNNNAGATLVALAALAAGHEVIIARGELVEIGGGFRVPDIMAQSGARLVEVGTTNRVRLADYAAAMTDNTALILVVHPSNFRIVGFTESPALADLAELAHERGAALMHDLGSGALLPTERWGMAHEPTVRESVVAGADVVCFSGDKLLGGPQAGIIVGKREQLATIERHPLMRAIRIDKLSLAALEATVRAYLDDAVERETPVWQAISQPRHVIQQRAERLVARLQEAGVPGETIAGESTVGGGSLPGETLPTTLCAIPPRAQSAALDPAALARELRQGRVPVIARVLRDQALLDLRTVAPGDDDTLSDLIVAAYHRIAPPRPARP